MLINHAIQGVASVYAGSSSSGVRRGTAAIKAEGRDEIVLSSEAQSFSALLQRAKGHSDVRQEKVDFYAQKIASGNYFVDASAIAEKILGMRN